MQSYTGVELIRVLLANKAGPILLIALTNHALDHLLSAVLEKKITRKVARLGSRSADETIAQYSLETMEMIAGKNRIHSTFGRDYAKMKNLEEDLKRLMNDFLKRDVESSKMMRHLELEYPVEHEILAYDMPPWVASLFEVLSAPEEGGWQTAGARKDTPEDKSIYAFWRQGHDLDYLHEARTAPPSKGKKKVPTNKYTLLQPEDNVQEGDDVDFVPEDFLADWNETVGETDADGDIFEDDAEEKLTYEDLLDHGAFFKRFDMDVIPPLPNTNRTLDELMEDPGPWKCSRTERQRLHDHWSHEVKVKLELQEIESFRRLREQHAQALADYNEGKIEVQRHVIINQL
jgi:hypothetical protein